MTYNRLNPRYIHLREWLNSLPNQMENTTEGQVLQDGRNLIKSFTAPDGTVLCVKRYHRPRGINSLVYSLGLRPPKGRRAYDYAGRLLAAGIETPQPVAYAEERHHGLLGFSYFVSLQCSYPHKMYEWGDAPEGSYEAFAQAFGRYAGRLHEAGILHRDFTPGNVLWEEFQGDYHFSLIDINQMDFGHVSLSRGCRNICKFWGPKHFIALIARAYAEQRGFDADECERRVMSCRERFWRLYLLRKPDRVLFHVEF